MRTNSLKLLETYLLEKYPFNIITPSPRGEWVKSTTYTALGLLCGDRKLLATVHAERFPLFCYTKYKAQGILCFEWDNGSWYIDILHWYHMIMVITRLYCCIIIPPASTKLKGGILVSPCPSVHLSVCPSVRLSVCGQNRVRSVSSTILIGSISYLHILSSNFRRCVACNARFNIFINLKFWRIFLIRDFDFVFFWLGIQYDSMVWVIMRRRGVYSEGRHSSCSSLVFFLDISGIF